MATARLKCGHGVPVTGAQVAMYERRVLKDVRCPRCWVRVYIQQVTAR